MSELSYNQEQDIITRLVDALKHEPERRYPSDTVAEVVDSWLPVYYTDIRTDWVDAGCPEPDELMPDNNEHNQLNIHNLMMLGLYELALSFALGTIWGDSVGEANTHAEALGNLRDNCSDSFGVGTMLDHFPGLKDLVQ